MRRSFTWFIAHRAAHVLDAIEDVDLGLARLQHGETVQSVTLVPARLESRLIPLHVARALAAVDVIEHTVLGNQ